MLLFSWKSWRSIVLCCSSKVRPSSFSLCSFFKQPSRVDAS